MISVGQTSDLAMGAVSQIVLAILILVIVGAAVGIVAHRGREQR